MSSQRRTNPERLMARNRLAAACHCAVWLLAIAAIHFSLTTSATPLTTLQYRINGTLLEVTPSSVAVPKGIGGAVLASVLAGGSTNSEASLALSSGAYVEAYLRGPGLPEPRRLVAAPNTPLLLPVLNLTGDYQLDGIRLVDAVTGATRLEGTPSSVPVKVFDEILVSRVTSRPLTLQEIQDKGIYIDESNFRAVEFEVAFVLDGKTIPIQFPVVAPKFTQSTELIPAAELEERLKQAAALNQQIASEVVQLPPEFETAQLNFQIQGINFQVVDESGGPPDLSLRIPPIPALMVIPGNIGYLNQFFSVQIFTENGAPTGSQLSVKNVKATLNLPPGPDRVASTNYTTPGDDPLRFARVGPDKLIQPVQMIVRPGADGVIGTPDDVGTLLPGETGTAEFLVEGLQEGLHVMDLDLMADMDGLVTGTVKVQGKAAGSVLVRNPRFSFAFSHPRTIRAGEPYEASITVLNTGVTPANLVSVTLNRNSISGATLEGGQTETVQLGTILPGQTATAKYRLRAQRTGAISFSNLTTSDDSVTGRFRFSMGVDERGVALSPDTLALPDFVNELPPGLVDAAQRVLGQALSSATAGQLPAGVKRVAKSIISRRAIELAEAGQRVRYGDPLKRVLADLLRDWQGGRVENDGFDQILRETDAGAEWRAALFAAMENADPLNGTTRLMDRAADYAGLGQSFALASADSGELQMQFGGAENSADTNRSTQPYALVYGGTNGAWAMAPVLSNAVFLWKFTNAPATADVAALIVGTNGMARQLRWQINSPIPTATYRFALDGSGELLQIDLNDDGFPDGAVLPVASDIDELPPMLVAVEQDLTIVSGRPASPCIGPSFGNYGTVLAIVYSKPVNQTSAGAPASYVVGGNNVANSVSVQPSGRVALMNLAKGISALIPRMLTITSVTDVRGNPLVSVPTAIRSFYPGTATPFTGGVTIKGRVLKGDGSPAIGVPVTLTMYDQAFGPYSCEAWVRRVSQVLTDTNGNFDLDFVMAGIPYSLSATDTSGLDADALRVIMESTLQDAADRSRLEQLATSAATANTLLGAFAAGSLPEAIAAVEGLDRAVVRDVVQIGSSRETQMVPIALRFRGRGTVVGTVVAADGVTPVPSAAVNLYPDPDSRELGRGVFADARGQFAFPGVPLGVFTVDVSTSDRRARTVAGLLDRPGQSTNLTIALPSTTVALGTIRGQVFEADNLTPHGSGQVFLGRFTGSTVSEVVRIVTTDAEGFWQATNVPVRLLDIVAVSADGMRKGTRLNITPAPDAITYANVTLEAVTRVLGRVQFDDGRPATNALVAGGAVLARSDAFGNFELQGVPIGRRTFSAGIEKNPAAGIDFTRLGSASASIVAGVDNYVVIKLRPAGRIFGTVRNAQGEVQPGVRVAIPLPGGGGFFWTDANAQGNYVFENLGLGNYTISAPANATTPQFNEQDLINQIRSGDEDKILAAFEEAVRVFVGADDPLITGEHANFRPSSWGFTTTRLRFDGESVNADVRFITQGTVSGVVQNHQRVPIGARVLLTGIGPSPSGLPVVTIRGERNSDPATGQFIFPGQLLAGQWTLQTASPFYPVVLKTNGFTTELNPNVTGIVMQFPPVQEVNGRIAGFVFNPDGSAAGAGVKVRINVSDDYEIQTDTNGFFDTQIAFPALGRSYLVDAFDPATGLRGRAGIGMTPGITNRVDVRLLTRNSAVVVNVNRANGSPAIGARVDLDHGSFPKEARLTGFADAAGLVVFSNLWEGTYSASAQFLESSTLVFGRAGATVAANQSRTVSITLGGTGTILGTFVKRDLVTPIFGAQVSIGGLGFANTDVDGSFRFDGVPPGTYRIVSADPVSGAAASTTASITTPDQVRTVLLVETARGEINGRVVDSYGTEFVSGASVRVSFSDGLTSSRTVTTGPDGVFSFPGSPAGAFSLSATAPSPSGIGTVNGNASGTLLETATNVTVDIPLRSFARLPVQVFKTDGVTPAPSVRITLSGPSSRMQDTDPDGQVLFNDLPLGFYSLVAVSQMGGELHNAAVFSTNITQRGTNATAILRLAGTGRIEGTVVGSDGLTPIGGAEVVLRLQSAPFAGEVRSIVTPGSGAFEFDDVPVGAFRLTAASVSLASAFSGSITNDSHTNVVTLQLGDSGALVGRIVRADGVTPVGGADVAIAYASQSANPGRAVFRTGADGRFGFTNVPLESIELTSAGPAFGGLIAVQTSLSANGQVRDLGDLRFDEAVPEVVSVFPTNTTINLPITTIIELTFSEALATNSIQTNGIYLRGSTGNVPAMLALLPDTNNVLRIVRLTSFTPLQSQRVYEITVLAGDILGANGSVIASGPRDLVGRPLAAPFVSRFATADNDPPMLLSIFPTNAEVQIDPRAVPRLSFNEQLQTTGFVFRVTGPGGDVPGSAAVGVDGRVLSFVPTGELLPNATYTITVSNVFDLAGNRAAGEPFVTTFATLDTVGPAIATLQIASNAPPVAGGTIYLEAILANTNEPGASVRYTRDFVNLGFSTNAPFRVPLTLPMSGSTTIRAIATDRYSNDGPFAELIVTVQSNQPPTVQFTRVSPPSGPVPSGSFVAVDVTGVDDDAVAELRAIVAGLGSGSLTNAANTNRVRVQGFVLASATTNGQVQIFAEAIDGLGQSSGQQVFTLLISDGSPPVLALPTPTNNARLTLGQPLELPVVVTENSSNVTLVLNVTGALTNRQTNVVVLTPNTPFTNLFTVPLDAAPPDGGVLNVQITASDLTGNTANLARTFRLPDATIPILVSLIPTNGATNLGTLQPILATFSEPLDTNTISSNSFVVRRDGIVLPGQFYLADSNRMINWLPAEPLKFGAAHEIVLTPLLGDPSGNSVAPQTNHFTVADFVIIQPTNQSLAVEGQRLRVAAGGTNPAGIRSVEFRVNTNAVVGVAPQFTNSLFVPMLAELGSNAFTLSASARLGGTNIARLGTASSSSVGFSTQASDINDGNRDGNYGAGSVLHTGGGLHEWAEIDLGRVTGIQRVEVYLRTDCCVDRNQIAVLVAATPFVAGDFTSASLPATYSNGAVEIYRTTAAFDSGSVTSSVPVIGRYVRVVHLGQNYLHIAEVEVVDGPTDGLTQTQELDPVNVSVVSRSGDYDGDGVSNGDEIDAGTDPFKADAAPVINAPATIEIVQNVISNVPVSVTDADGNLRSLRVEALDGTNFFGSGRVDFFAHGFSVSSLAQINFEAVPAASSNFTAIRYNHNSVPWWPDGPDDNFSARFRGLLQVPTNGLYTFSLTSDDGSRLWIDGVVITDLDGTLGTRAATAELSAGSHTLEARFYENTGGETMNAFWAGPGVAQRHMLADDFSLFNLLAFAESGTNTVLSATNLSQLDATLRLRRDQTNEISIQLTAVDADGLTRTRMVTVVTLGDLDGDGIPDRDDPDIDGDGLTNAQEITLGTNPRRADTDGDDIADGVDPLPLTFNHAPVAGAGGALRFDGVDDVMQVPSSPSLQITGSQTIEFWIKPDNFDQTRNPISKAYAGEGGMDLLTDGRLAYYYGNLGSNAGALNVNYQAINSVQILPRGAWTHVALVRDLTAMKVRWFFNGEQVNEVNALFTNAVADNLPFLIGSGWNRPLLGEMDEVRIWNRALTAGEIQAGRFSRAFGNEPGLVGAWSFEEIAGNTARDFTTNQNHGWLGTILSGSAPARLRSAAPLGLEPQVALISPGTTAITLTANDADNDPLTFSITSLPARGHLFQTTDGVTPSGAITSIPAQVTDSQHRVLLTVSSNTSGATTFSYRANDGLVDSISATATVNLLPASPVSVASNDIVTAFSGSSANLANLLTNDSASATKLVLARGPTNGTAVLNANGTVTYTPAPGFTGTDQLMYAVVDSLAWNRYADYQPGVSMNSTQGNPSRDRFGFNSWRMEFFRGEAVTNARPWFAQPPGLMLWDTDWYGNGGYWAFQDNFGAVLWRDGISHNLSDANWAATIPAMVWISPLGDTAVDIVGVLELEWSGNGNIGSPVDVDVVIARRTPGTGAVTPLMTRTVSKPTPADSATERTNFAVGLTNVALLAGDEIIVSARARNPVNQSRSVQLYDQQLYIQPASATRFATVTVNVLSNSAPQLPADTGFALKFDGLDDFVSLGGFTLTNTWSLSAWVKPDAYQTGRRIIAGVISQNRDWSILISDGEFVAIYANGQPARSGIRPVSGRWYHVSGVCDGTNLVLYVDGRRAGSTVLSAPYVPSTADFRIGSSVCCGEYLAGTIDDVRAWNRALSAEEVSASVFTELMGNEAGLLTWLRFNAGTGTTAADSSVNGRNGTLGPGNAATQPAWVPSSAPFVTTPTTPEDVDAAIQLTGTDADNDPLTRIISGLPMRGQLYQTSDGITRGAAINGDLALNFDGTTDLVTVPETSASNLSGRTNWSISAWIKPRTAVQAYPVIYAEGYWRTSLGLQTGTGRLDSWINDTAQIVSTRAVEFDKWQHVALVCDGVERRFYIDGQFAGSGSAPIVSADSSGAAIGGVIAEQANGRNRFQGSIDEVAIWGKALSQEELSVLATAPMTGAESNLLAWWPMNEASGSVITDTTGNGTTGTLGGGNPAYVPARELNDSLAFAGRLPVVTDAQGRVIYAPLTDLNGADSFRYRVSDGKAFSTDGDRFIQVQSLNDPPVAVADFVFAMQGLPQTITNVLTNDTDPENSALSLVDFTLPTHGTLTNMGGGEFVYTASPGYSGPDSFTYRITDGTNLSVPGTVSITVEALSAFRWINPAGGSWSVATNWNQNRVPNSNDSVVVDLAGTYTITLNSNVHVRRFVVGATSGQQTLNFGTRDMTIQSDSFVLGNGRLIVANGTFATTNSTVTIDGGLTWTGGTMSGPGETRISPGAFATFAGGNIYLGDARRLINHSTVDFTGGFLWIGDRNLPGASFQNHGMLNLTNGADILFWAWNQFTNVSFVNTGTLNKLGTAQSEVQIPFINSGMINVSEGILRTTRGFAHSGGVAIATNSTLQLDGGIITFSPASVAQGPGTLQLANGSGTISSPLAATNLTVSGGSWVITVPQTFSRYTHTGGDLGSPTPGSPVDFTAVEFFQWSGGSIFGPGTFEVSPSAVAAITGGAKYVNDSRRLWNRTTLAVSGYFVAMGNPTLAGAVFENAATLNLAGAVSADWLNYNSSRTVSFVNNGVINKTGPGSLSFVNVEFTNAGTINISEGTFRVQRDSLVSGTNNLGTNGVLELSSGNHVFTTNSAVNGGGTLVLSGGSGTFASSLNLTGAVQLLNGTWTFNAPQTFVNFSQSAGVLGGTADVTVLSNFVWTAGTMTGNGLTELGTNAVGTLSGAGDKFLQDNRRLLNRGSLSLTAGRLMIGNPNVAGATLENLGAFNVDESARVEWHNFSSSRPVLLVNRGTLNRTGATNTVSIVSTPFLNEGVLSVQSGTLRAQNTFTNLGTVLISASGTLQLAGGSAVFGPLANLSGTGILDIQEPVTLQGPVDFGALEVSFSGSASLSGAFAIANSSGGRIRILKTMSLPGDLNLGGQLILGSSSYTLTINGALTLAATGVIDNPGTIFVGSFVNGGGTINGNPPIVGGATLIRITGISVPDKSGNTANGLAGGEPGNPVEITWSGPAGNQFAVEISSKAVDWKPAEAQTTEIAPGIYNATVKIGTNSVNLFRLKRLAP